LPLEKDFDSEPIDAFVWRWPFRRAVSGARTIGRPAPGWDTDVAGRMLWHPDYDVKYCDACGLYFKNRMLRYDVLAEFNRVLPFEILDSGEFFRLID
jgi:hypothetical protein